MKRALIASVILFSFLIAFIVLAAIFQPRITQDGLTLLHTQPGFHSTTVTHIGFSRTYQKNLLGQWRYSPDGQYIESSHTRPSHHGVSVYRVDTLESVCSQIKSPSLDPFRCDFLRLYNGQWWSPTQSIVMERPSKRIEQAVGNISKSPDGQWLVAQTEPSYTTEGGWVYGQWTLVHTVDDIEWDFDVPRVSDEYCQIGNKYDWSEDSRLFATYHGRQNHTFIWKIGEDGNSPQLVADMSAPTCPADVFWDKSKFTGTWPE